MQTITQTAPIPDAELIALCAAFTAAASEFNAAYDQAPAGEDEALTEAKAEPASQRVASLAARLETVHAATPAGVCARAKALALYAGHGAYDLTPNGTYPAAALMRALFRDALAVSGAPVLANLAAGDAA